jgi:hypothetical protein
MLAKVQKDNISKFNIPDISTEAWCTDKSDHHQEALFKPQAADRINVHVSCIIAVIPRGLERDERTPLLNHFLNSLLS